MTNYSQRYAADDSNTAGAFYFDTFGGVDYPSSKVLWGAEGAVNHASAATPLPVTAVITGDALTALQLLDNAVSGAGFNITQFAGAAVPIGAGVEATAVRVTLATDSTGVLSVDDNGGSLTVDGTFWQATQPVSIAATVTVTGAGGSFPVTDSGGSLTVDNPALSVTGGGVEASALRVTLASDSTGLLSVDDNGGSLTVDGTVAFSNTTIAVTNVGTFAVQSTLQAGTAYAGKLRLTDGTTDAEVVPLAGYNAQAVAIVDGSGAQITSFGGGTQYTEGDTDATITGTAVMWEDTGNTLRAASAASPLPIGDAGGSITVDGTFWQATQPVSGTVDLGATDNAVLDAIAASVAGATPAGTNNIGDVDVLTVPADPFGVNADAGSAAGSISAKLRFIASTGIPITGTVTVGSHAVTNTGTFVVQLNGTAGANLTDIETNTNSLAVVGSGEAATAQRVTIASDGTGKLSTVTTVAELTGGGAAHDAADSGNPHKIGARATTSVSALTPVANGDRTDLFAGSDGVLLVRNGYSLEDVVQARTTNTDGASTAFTGELAGPGAGVRLWIKKVTISNSSATFCTVDLRDGVGGAVLWTLPVPATGGITEHFDPPLRLTANTALAFDASAAIATLSISANGFKSKV